MVKQQQNRVYATWTRDNYGLWARSVGHRKYLKIFSSPLPGKRNVESEMFSARTWTRGGGARSVNLFSCCSRKYV